MKTKMYQMNVSCGDFSKTYSWHPQEVASMRHFGEAARGRRFSSEFAMMKNVAVMKAFHDGLNPMGALVEFEEVN